jgi:hypothetical protein
MTTRSWIRQLFAHPITRPVCRAPARCPPDLEFLEAGLAPAVHLLYSGPESALQLQELVGGATPAVAISETTPGVLKIDLGAQTFDPTSTAAPRAPVSLGRLVRRSFCPARCTSPAEWRCG